MEQERGKFVHHKQRNESQEMAITAIAAVIILIAFIVVALVS
jgi:hypothetical protein